jgi:CRISPR-associated endonuclease/helicase Cas3
MNPIPIDNAFGKMRFDKESDAQEWHPLIDHMVDVAACFVRLAQCRSIRRALEQCAGRKLTDQDIARLAVLVFLHDVGKANSGFQAKRWKIQIPQWWPVNVTAGHGAETTLLLQVSDAAKAIEPLIEKIRMWGDAVDSLLTASISHHGRPIKDGPGVNSRIWESHKGKYDPAVVLSEIARRAPEIFPKAFDVSDQVLPAAPRFGHLFAGLVQLADWLGSDTRFFPFSKPHERRDITAPSMADKAARRLGLDSDHWRAKIVADSPRFADIFGGFDPYPVQTAMSDEALGPLVILESETGSGKTEAALWRYVHLFRSGFVDSLYFALPTRSAATQLYQRVQDTLKRLWPENPPLAVRALPGYVAADGEEIKAMANFEVFWNDSPDDQKAHHRWAAENAKRFLAAPIAVGTLDQALLGALQVRHAHLRHATLARSLLVVDEVHASDAYMTVLLERLLKAHLGCGGQALLLSATLGSSARHRHLALTPDGQSGLIRSMPFDLACAVPYPAISDGHGTRATPGTGRSKRVCWHLRDGIAAPGKIAQWAIEAAAQGAKVLIIRNTVSTAVTTLHALEKQVPDLAWLFTVNGVRTLHHSRFSRQDRPELDAAIEKQLGKTRPAGPLIVVGTQTLEQSLDIDADFLITDLCPMDVLLQRIGRLHRHENERPKAFRQAQAIVLTPAGNDLSPLLVRSQHGLGRFHNGGGVYADLRILEATQRGLLEKPEVVIPEDNRYLVEAATHPDTLCALETQLGEAWEGLAQKIEGYTCAQKTLGHVHSLDFEQAFGEAEFQHDVRTATRLGAQDRAARFSGVIGPFGFPLKELPIRHYLLPKELPLDAEPSNVSHQDDCIAFRLGTASFRYSRLGLERLKDE